MALSLFCKKMHTLHSTSSLECSSKEGGVIGRGAADFYVCC